jgi:membrane-bound serine protease (ClpP class)
VLALGIVFVVLAMLLIVTEAHVTSGGLIGAGAALALARSARSNRRLRPRSGPAAIVGHIGVIRLSNSGAQVYLDGGLWRAKPSPLEKENVLHDGDRVVVEHVNGLTLYVRKAEELELYP